MGEWTWDAAEQLKFAESLVEDHEVGRIATDTSPYWLGYEDFEDLTSRWIISCGRRNNCGDSTVPLHSIPIENDDDLMDDASHISISSNSADDGFEDTCPEPSQTCQGLSSNDKVAMIFRRDSDPFSPQVAASADSTMADDGFKGTDQEAREPAPSYTATHDEETADQPASHPVYCPPPENNLDLRTCEALRMMRRSERRKDQARQNPKTSKSKMVEIHARLVKNLYPDEDPYLKETSDDLWDEAAATVIQSLKDRVGRHMLETSVHCLKRAVDAYFQVNNTTRDWITDDLVSGALQNIKRLKKGKEVWVELERPMVDWQSWKDWADWLLWEAEDYCWTVKYLDVDVDAEVLKYLFQNEAAPANVGDLEQTDSSDRMRE